MIGLVVMHMWNTLSWEYCIIFGTCPCSNTITITTVSVPLPEFGKQYLFWLETVEFVKLIFAHFSLLIKLVSFCPVSAWFCRFGDSPPKFTWIFMCLFMCVTEKVQRSVYTFQMQTIADYFYNTNTLCTLFVLCPCCYGQTSVVNFREPYKCVPFQAEISNTN